MAYHGPAYGLSRECQMKVGSQNTLAKNPRKKNNNPVLWRPLFFFSKARRVSERGFPFLDCVDFDGRSVAVVVDSSAGIGP